MRDSLFLMAQPSFLDGMARVLDLGDTMTGYNYSQDGDAADHAAIWADWELIAADLRRASEQFSRGLTHVEKEQETQ